MFGLTQKIVSAAAGLDGDGPFSLSHTHTHTHLHFASPTNIPSLKKTDV